MPPHVSRRVLTVGSVVAAAATVVAPLSAPRAVAAAADRPALATVRYDGVAVSVPASWPVYDLAADPARCVRFDVHAVYLGVAGADQRCPAHLVGRTEAVQVLPADPAAPPAAGSGTVARTLSTGRVRVVATYGADRAVAASVVASAVRLGAPTVAAPRTAAATGTTAPRSVATTDATQDTAGAGRWVGNGFDTCTAPSLGAMRAWLTSSPYRAANVYIGGAMRACGDGNLSASWVGTVTGMGWRLVPTYVGLQAPCSSFSSGRLSSDPAKAATQGTAAADDAVALAKTFALPARSPLYFDMEYYPRSTSCSSAVLSFLQAWTGEVHALGYRSGVYGSTPSVIGDLVSRLGTGYAEPDDVWFARWNGLDSVGGESGLPDTAWTHHRLHQYSGGGDTAYGGYTLNIDPDAVDGDVVGAPAPCVDYPAESYGPDGCAAGFRLTGPQQYWRLGSPYGLRARMRWTRSNGSAEANGATWSPVLDPGTYGVWAYLPAHDATAHAHYTVTDAAGDHRKVVDQAAAAGGWAWLGDYTTGPTGSVTVHVGDDGDPAGATTVGVDAMRFHLEAPLDATPPSGTVTTPVAGTAVRPGATVSVAGSFTDDVGVTKVVFLAAGPDGRWQEIGTDAHGGDGPYAVSWPVDAADGSVLSFAARVYDGAGHETTVPATAGVVVDGTPPAGGLTAPARPYALAGTPRTLAWSMTDASTGTPSGIDHYDVRVRSTAPDGTSAGWVRPAALQVLTATTASYGPLTAGREYCFEVRGRDRAGNLSAWSAPRCVTRPLDDPAIGYAAGWSWVGADAYYGGGYTGRARRGAALTSRTVTATRLALLATTCGRCGRVTVSLGDRLLATVDLRRPGWHPSTIVELPAFAPWTGRVTIRSVSSAGYVRIDGLAVGHD